MTEQLTGYEASSVAEVGAILDASPADANEVYLATIGHSERAIAAVAAKRAGSGGGGSTPYVGATVSNAGGGVFVANGDAPVPFNHTNVDSDGFWDAVNHKLVIPAGKGGVYSYGFVLSASMDAAAATFLAGSVLASNNNGDAPNPYAYAAYPNTSTSDVLGVAASGVGPFLANDTVQLLADWHNSTDTTLALYAYSCQLFVVRLGDAP